MKAQQNSNNSSLFQRGELAARKRYLERGEWVLPDSLEQRLCDFVYQNRFDFERVSRLWSEVVQREVLMQSSQHKALLDPVPYTADLCRMHYAAIQARRARRTASGSGLGEMEASLETQWKTIFEQVVLELPSVDMEDDRRVEDEIFEIYGFDDQNPVRFNPNKKGESSAYRARFDEILLKVDPYSDQPPQEFELEELPNVESTPATVNDQITKDSMLHSSAESILNDPEPTSIIEDVLEESETIQKTEKVEVESDDETFWRSQRTVRKTKNTAIDDSGNDSEDSQSTESTENTDLRCVPLRLRNTVIAPHLTNKSKDREEPETKEPIQEAAQKALQEGSEQRNSARARNKELKQEGEESVDITMESVVEVKVSKNAWLETELQIVQNGLEAVGLESIFDGRYATSGTIAPLPLNIYASLSKETLQLSQALKDDVNPDPTLIDKCIVVAIRQQDDLGEKVLSSLLSSSHVLGMQLMPLAPGQDGTISVHLPRNEQGNMTWVLALQDDTPSELLDEAPIQRVLSVQGAFVTQNDTKHPMNIFGGLPTYHPWRAKSMKIDSNETLETCVVVLKTHARLNSSCLLKLLSLPQQSNVDLVAARLAYLSPKQLAILDSFSLYTPVPGEPVLVMAFRGSHAVQQVLNFIGPEDPSIARRLHSQSLRAKFGRSRKENVVHCSRTPAHGQRDLYWWFGRRLLKGVLLRPNFMVALPPVVQCELLSKRNPAQLLPRLPKLIRDLQNNLGFEIANITLIPPSASIHYPRIRLVLSKENALSHAKNCQEITAEFDVSVYESSASPRVSADIKCVSSEGDLSDERWNSRWTVQTVVAAVEGLDLTLLDSVLADSSMSILGLTYDGSELFFVIFGVNIVSKLVHRTSKISKAPKQARDMLHRYFQDTELICSSALHALSQCKAQFPLPRNLSCVRYSPLPLEHECLRCALLSPASMSQPRRAMLTFQAGPGQCYRTLLSNMFKILGRQYEMQLVAVRSLRNNTVKVLVQRDGDVVKDVEEAISLLSASSQIEVEPSIGFKEGEDMGTCAVMEEKGMCSGIMAKGSSVASILQLGELLASLSPRGLRLVAVWYGRKTEGSPCWVMIFASDDLNVSAESRLIPLAESTSSPTLRLLSPAQTQHLVRGGDIRPIM